jgi:2-dehydropantoate 2-reductase
MNIAIVGPGAIGTLVAHFLLKTEKDVVLIDKTAERADSLQKAGITVTTLENKKIHVTPQVCTFETARARHYDLVIIAVKSYDTHHVAKKLKSLAGEETYVLTLQNGIGNFEILEEYIDAERLIGGVTQQAAFAVGPGEIRHAGTGDTILGFFKNKKAPQDLARRKFLSGVARLFNNSGMTTKSTDDMKAALWSKFIVNIGINALSAVTRLKNGELLRHEWTRKIMHDAVMEAAKVAKRRKITLSYSDPLKKVEAVARDTHENISSMLQDVLRRKTTEVDYINGALVAEAESYGIAAPTNTMLTNIIKAIEASYQARVDAFPPQEGARAR